MRCIRHIQYSCQNAHWLWIPHATPATCQAVPGSFTSYIVNSIAYDLKSDVQKKPHLAEDALAFISLCEETKDSEKASEMYQAALRSSFAERRWRDLNTLIKNCDMEALQRILHWRRDAHYVRANHCRESFLLGRNFGALKGLSIKATCVYAPSESFIWLVR